MQEGGNVSDECETWDIEDLIRYRQAHGIKLGADPDPEVLDMGAADGSPDPSRSGCNRGDDATSAGATGG